MRVNEIFKSIEGEGKRAGLPCTFIRLYGCNLSCAYCDTVYSCKGNEYHEMSIAEILKKVDEIGVPCITVTGGEPLIHPGIESLLSALTDNGYFVNVETNGTRPPIRMKTLRQNCSLFYTMDYKCPSSEMSGCMNIEDFNKLRSEDVLKFVVGSHEDLEAALEVIEKLDSMPQIYFSPVFGSIEPKEIVEWMLDKRLYECKVQLQLHKFIWEPDKRGV